MTTAKKKTVKKVSKKTATKMAEGDSVKTSTPVEGGRERKLLLRLSVDEYETLKRLSDKAGVSMAMHIRTSAGL